MTCGSTSGSCRTRRCGALRIRMPLSSSLRRVRTRLQRHGIVVLRVVGAVDERHPSPPGQFDQLAHCLTVHSELGAVATLELSPLPGIVTEPAAQPGARSELPKPPVQLELPFRHPPRPESLDQETQPIAPAWVFVHALELDHARCRGVVGYVFGPITEQR